MDTPMVSGLVISPERDDDDQKLTHLHDLPNETLTLLLGYLRPNDLAIAQCVCSSFYALGSNPGLWEAACYGRWKTWSSERWGVMVAAGQWKRIYAERNAIDDKAAAAVDDMPFPCKRHECFRTLAQQCGEDAIEALEAVAVGEGTPGLGRRFWADLGARHLIANEAAKQLNALKQKEAPDEPLDNGALVLARTFSMGSSTAEGDEKNDSSWVPAYLDQLAEELCRRVAAAGKCITTDHRSVLEMLNHLLFGPRAVADAPSSFNRAGEEEFNFRPPVPEGNFGLGLTGNRNNYYDVRNSMLHQVLIRRTGIPITLAVVQCAIGVRCGMHLQAVGMPCHLLTKFGQPGDPHEVFMDCFDSGRIMTREEACDLMTGLGLPREERFLTALKSHEVHARMCANLVHIMRKQKDYRPLWQLLEMLRKFHPLPDYLLMHAQMVLLRLEMPISAQKDIEELAACYTKFPAERMSLMIGSLSRQINDLMTKQRQEAETVNTMLPGLKCRIGDIVRYQGAICPHQSVSNASHQSYRGVVISWDSRCAASAEWKSHTNVAALKHGAEQPFYRILVDTRDRFSQATYVAQESIELLAPEAAAEAELSSISDGNFVNPSDVCELVWQIQHPELGFHFEEFRWRRPDGQVWPHYVPNAYIASRFPLNSDNGNENKISSP